jgi:hypothetical protein
MMYVQKPVDFTPAPAGVHKAVCSRFIDLGTRKNEWQGATKDQHRVCITWQVPAVRVSFDGNDLPLQHNEYYTWTMSDMGNLRPMLESWRGRPFTPADLTGPPDGFNTRKLIGVGCQLQIMHNDKDRAYASAVLPLNRSDWPYIEGDPIYFQMAELPLDMVAFESLTDGLKKTIQESPEWVAMNGPHEWAGKPSADADSVADDAIPF